MSPFVEKIRAVTEQPLLTCTGLEVIQANIGLRCDLACTHCHVAASPKRTEEMDWATMEYILGAVDQSNCHFVDLTGGAPELNRHFQQFIEALSTRDLTVQVRTNLTVLTLPEMVHIAPLMKKLKVQLVASMPCYQEKNVDDQRGEGSYKKAIQAIRMLNDLGYGLDAELPLNLVYNPGGPFLPPAQCQLEADYKRELEQRFGIHFSQLLTITNMPIGRYRADLRRQGQETAYQQLLHDSFNPGTLDNLMCRNQISVAWDGTLFDCDFNLALKLPLQDTTLRHIKDFNLEKLAQRTVVTGDHCFACTAGSGSSCGGSLVA